MNFRVIPLALLAVLATGCLAIPYPHKVTKFPGVSGVLVTQTTGEPIPGVTVKVTRRYELPGTQNPTQAQIDASIIDERLTTTSANGWFQIEPEESPHFVKFLPLVPFDPFWMPVLLDISYQLAPGQAFCEASYPPYLGFYIDHPQCIVGMASGYGPFRLGEVVAGQGTRLGQYSSPTATGQAVTPLRSSGASATHSHLCQPDQDPQE